jgi:hypothetical protein
MRGWEEKRGKKWLVSNEEKVQATGITDYFFLLLLAPAYFLGEPVCLVPYVSPATHGAFPDSLPPHSD